jgi:dTMP kinase
MDADSRHDIDDDPVAMGTSTSRLWATRGFPRLWIAQVVSAFGDWIGFLAIIEVARRIGGDQHGSSIALVMTARVLPGFFLASVGGVIVDRLNRKRLLISCDVVRAGVLLTIPFIDRVWALVVASLVLELATSLWGPAKEAIVPNIVPTQQLTAANSLSLVAAYGTFPAAALAFIGLAKVGEFMGGDAVGQVELALVVDSVTFLVAAALIASLPIRARSKAERQASNGRIDLSSGIHELREGWSFIALSPQVRAVLVGMGTGMIGGGMLIPLGAVFNDEVLGAGNAGFGTILVTLGMGVALGVATLSLIQGWLDKEHGFVAATLGAGVSLLFAVTSSNTWLTLGGVVVLGVCAGAVYVLGFTLLHEHVEDELRGRVFSALYTLVRFCLLVAIAFGGFLSDGFNWLFDVLFDGEVGVGPYVMELPGVRGALWLAGLLVLGAGGLAGYALRGSAKGADSPSGNPSEGPSEDAS